LFLLFILPIPIFIFAASAGYILIQAAIRTKKHVFCAAMLQKMLAIQSVVGVYRAVLWGDFPVGLVNFCPKHIFTKLFYF
jgi:hypothetical protein